MTAFSEAPTTTWYVRMKHGAKGEDHTQHLWEQHQMAAILFGGWRLADILTDRPEAPTRSIDPGKLTESHLQPVHRRAQADRAGGTPWKEPPWKELDKEWLNVPRTFFGGGTNGVKVGDGMVASYEVGKGKTKMTWLVSARVGHEFREHPQDLPPCDADWGREYFKGRSIDARRRFDLAKLPSAYRLLRGTGQGTLQRMKVYKLLSDLLFTCDSEQAVCRRLASQEVPQLLRFLSDKHWEMICAEYLRDLYKDTGLRLLLGVGGTLKGLDIVAVAGDAVVVGQCKNSESMSGPAARLLIEELINAEARDRYLFVRGDVGAVGALPEGVKVVTGTDIERWLGEPENADYVRALATK